MAEKCNKCNELVAEIWNWCPFCGSKRHTLASEGQSFPTKAQSAGPRSGQYGAGVRAQVFEVIVRQALSGAPWQAICSGPMQVNDISEADIEQEVIRRLRIVARQSVSAEHPVLSLPDPRRRLFAVVDELERLSKDVPARSIFKDLEKAAQHLAEVVYRIPKDERSRPAKNALHQCHCTLLCLIGTPENTELEEDLAKLISQMLETTLKLPIYKPFTEQTAYEQVN